VALSIKDNLGVMFGWLRPMTSAVRAQAPVEIPDTVDHATMAYHPLPSMVQHPVISQWTAPGGFSQGQLPFHS
jgi:hypothetical protein